MTSTGFVLLLLCGGAALSACQRSTSTSVQSEEQRSGQEPTPTQLEGEAEGHADAAVRVDTAKAGETSAQQVPTQAPGVTPKEAAAPKKRYVVAALGDSITDARVGGGGYLAVLREQCPGSVFLNFGKGGDMTNQMRRRFESDIRPQIGAEHINTLLVYGGVNDLYSDLTAGRKNDRIEEDLAYIYRVAKASRLSVVAVTVSPWGGFSKYWNPRRGQNTKLLNSWIMGQVAGGLVDKAVDSYAPLSCGDPEVLCHDYETRSHDGLHPGPEGHAILGQKLAAEAFADCL